MRSSLWGVIVVVVAWVGFLLGYALASHSGMKAQGDSAPAAEASAAPSAGGYGR